MKKGKALLLAAILAAASQVLLSPASGARLNDRDMLVPMSRLPDEVLGEWCYDDSGEYVQTETTQVYVRGPCQDDSTIGITPTRMRGMEFECVVAKIEWHQAIGYDVHCKGGEIITLYPSERYGKNMLDMTEQKRAR
jgi:hypothetical protein